MSTTKKILSASVAALIAAAGTISAAVPAQASTTSCVSNMCSWKDANLGGDRGAWDAANVGYVGNYWNDSISSANNRNWRYLYFHVDANYSGPWLRLDPGEVVLNFNDYSYYRYGGYLSWNDAVSSYRS
ncbi:peptidase inhibitor family I36 protein [Sinomonas sp. JGH33]|uniref:Peptidase inhibitor family I36 protein n=1 Tax=Sinomonas terricola TaxID=3110330 RepID=A0ABU5T1I1_9MICC|nr:peptidase inhibitor family I36 protein [Sinomonas sp. JGH33]MEA5453517.1 peptidase inhibitor family I36 protein [Sinomonas sp. JGH33]